MFKIRLLFHFTLSFGIAIGVSILICSTSASAADGIAQSYKAVGNVAPGAIVGVSLQDTASVELATYQNVNRLVGVVSDKPLVVLNATDPSAAAVVINGVTDVLVSDYNGQIKAGDKITVSRIPGIGQKATTSSTIVGTARNDVAQKGSITRTITDDKGKNRTVTISLVSVHVGISTYAAPEKRSIVPGPVQDFAERLAGHEVPAIRVFIAMSVMLLVVVGTIVILYSSIRSSILSIGRNPLSAPSIRRSLLQICATVLTISMIGLGIVYFVLKT